MSSTYDKAAGYAFYISKHRNNTKTFPEYDTELFPFYGIKFLRKEMAQDIIRKYHLYDNYDPNDENYKNQVNNLRFLIEQKKINDFTMYFEMINELYLGSKFIKSEIPVKIPFEAQRYMCRNFLYTKSREAARINAFLENHPINMMNLAMAIYNEVFAQVDSYLFVYDDRLITRAMFEEILYKKTWDENNKSPLYITGVAEINITTN